MMISNHRKPRAATRISYAPTDISFKQKYQLKKNYVIINLPASALGERYLFLASSSSAAYAPPHCYAALFPASVSRETNSYHSPPKGGEAVYIQAAGTGAAPSRAARAVVRHVLPPPVGGAHLYNYNVSILTD